MDSIFLPENNNGFCKQAEKLSRPALSLSLLAAVFGVNLSYGFFSNKARTDF